MSFAQGRYGEAVPGRLALKKEAGSPINSMQMSKFRHLNLMQNVTGTHALGLFLWLVLKQISCFIQLFD